MKRKYEFWGLVLLGVIILVVLGKIVLELEGDKLEKNSIVELEEFLSTFTVQPVLSNYTEGDEEEALYFTLYYLAQKQDSEVSFREGTQEYIVHKSVVNEMADRYFGINLTHNGENLAGVRLEGENYLFEKYYQAGGGYAKIDSVKKEGENYILLCHTVNSEGEELRRPTEPVDGGPVLFEFRAVVAPYNYKGENAWRLLELQAL